MLARWSSPRPRGSAAVDAGVLTRGNWTAAPGGGCSGTSTPAPPWRRPMRAPARRPRSVRSRPGAAGPAPGSGLASPVHHGHRPPPARASDRPDRCRAGPL